jgi:hypothetical protein
MILYAPRTVVKFRSTADDSLQRMFACVGTLYQGRMRITECLSTNEWAMTGVLGDGITSRQIPRHHRATTHPDGLSTAIAFHYRIQGAGLKTQNYDKGFEKFILKFDPDEEMTATVANGMDCREDRSLAVYCTQGPRRCLLLDPEDGLSDDETLWTALAAWASFQPRKGNPRSKPGQLFYPTEASHVLEKYWHYLLKLNEHPDFASEPQVCQERMLQFSKALAKMKHKSFVPKSVAEAEESS